METKQFNLTQNERDVIVISLNNTWLDATNKLAGKDLGDLERKYYEQTKDQSKKLLLYIGGELDFS
jgi:hypothetical protein